MRCVELGKGEGGVKVAIFSLIISNIYYIILAPEVSVSFRRVSLPVAHVVFIELYRFIE